MLCNSLFYVMKIKFLCEDSEETLVMRGKNNAVAQFCFGKVAGNPTGNQKQNAIVMNVNSTQIPFSSDLLLFFFNIFIFCYIM